MIIQHNIMAMGAYRSYLKNTNSLGKNLEKLSSGYRINRAGDDAAGLAISEKMRAQITGLDAAQKNVQDGISLVQTAEGALQEVQDTLNRMVYLATQSANGTYDNEVDRANLQKEVDALCAEIDRIADSSNFNGINLLDGSLGLNVDAISVSSADAIEAADGAAITIPDANFGALDAVPPTAHVEGENRPQVDPSFNIDLTGLSIANSDHTAGDTATVTITLGGTAFDIEVNGDVDTLAASDVITKALADTTNFLTADSNGDAANDSVVFSGANGDYLFEVGSDGNKLTFTFAGIDDGAGNISTELTEDQATEINTLLGNTVVVTCTHNDEGGAGATSDVTDQLQHATVDVVQAEAEVAGGLAGIHLTLTADMIAEGATLTIDGNDFSFTYDPDTTGDGVINLSAYDVGSEEAIHAAVDLLSQQTEFEGQNGRWFKIGSVDGDTIAIDQREPSDVGSELATIDDIKGLISSAAKGIEAAAAGTTIEIDAAGLVDGNTITIDGKAFVFAEDAADVPDGAVHVPLSENAVADLALALENEGYTVETDGNKVTVRNADVDAEAPVVLGKGLTLQIGDTSASYNQLTVSVEDMHVEALGLADISIATQEGAADAVDRIKAAINDVSMTRGTLGATQNRLEHTANNLAVMEENIQDAESSIRDTDMAEEMMAYTKNNILIQSAQAMLAQANTVPQGVLQLLQ